MSQHNQHQQSSNEIKHNNEWPKLKFLGGFNKEVALEVEQKGWIQFVLVEMIDGKKYQLTFYDINAVKVRVETHSKEQKLPFEAVPGMIVLEKVTLKDMKTAVKELSEQGEFGFFTYLKEWDPEKEKRLHEKFHSGVNVGTYEYPTVSEDELGEE